MSDGRQEELRRRLRTLGFDDVRFAATSDPAGGEKLREWLDAGMHGDMQWMERTAEKRLDPQQVLPGTRSIILLGVSYWREELHGRKNAGAKDTAPKWARYAAYLDYHDTMKPALVAAGRALEELFDIKNEDYRYYVDTGPVLERSWAARAGIGFIGKNAMLISREHGNWLLLAAILSRVPFTPDEPIRKTVPEASRSAGVGLLCGKCERCLTACPTNAFAAPGVLDARRCISYQTIENKGIIPRELREGIGTHIYGCDVCLEVCPWNRFAQQGRQLLLTVRDQITQISMRELLELTPPRFAELFRGTPIKRLKLAGLLRNACVVAGNLGDATLLAQLKILAQHELPMIRAHAAWAIMRLGGRAILSELRERETDPSVLAEYEM